VFHQNYIKEKKKHKKFTQMEEVEELPGATVIARALKANGIVIHV
jgi:hypothetical protein